MLQLQQRVDQQAAQNTQLLASCWRLLLASIGYWAYKIKRMQMSFRRLAETDALTGISNRHHFTRQAEQALAHCAGAARRSALVMFDLDHFKAINDRYGHATGDWVLSRVAQDLPDAAAVGTTTSAASAARSSRSCCRLRPGAATRLARGVLRPHRRDRHRAQRARFAVTASFGVSAARMSGYD